MQDRESFQTVKPQFPELEQLKCPRCESTNTKFCYYNNYNLSQPRHFCKNCRRYWTKGGALRNIPVGGSTRKNNSKKRSKPESSVANSIRTTQETSSRSQPEPPSLPTTSAIPSLKEPASRSGADPRGGMYGVAVDPDHKMLDITGSFSSLLAANSGYGSVLEGLNPTNGPGCKMVQMGGFGENFSFREGASRGGESSSRSWSGGNGNGNGSGWPDLGIYTPGPGSNFQTQ